MPCYEYRNKRTGEIVELIRPANERDDVPGHERLIVPSRMTGLQRGLQSEDGAGYKVPRALRQLEQGKHSAGSIARHFGMPVDFIKKTWGMA